MFRLDLEKAEKPEFKLSTGSSKKQKSSRKISTSALLTTPKSLTEGHHKLWNILKEMGIPDHLTCLLRNLYAGQEATWTWNNRLVPNLERSTSRLYIVTLLFNLYAEYIMRNTGLEEAQAGIKTAGRNTITSDMQMTPHIWQKAKKN